MHTPPSLNDAALARARQAAGEAAASLVTAGMTVGLGTGDSAGHAVRALARRGLSGLRCVATSLRTADLARGLGLALVELDDLPGGAPVIDLTIDGADEVDPALRLIKGAGGALLREKLVAHASHRLVIVADVTKLVTRLGERRLVPVEIVPFGIPQTLARLDALCPGAVLRSHGGALVITDGGNRLVDVPVPGGVTPGELHARLKATLGVIDTGFFLGEAAVVYIGDAQGDVLTLSRA